MLQEIRFRHNKHSQNALYLSLIIFVFLGLFACYLILDLIGITKGTMQEVPQYFKDHPDHAIYTIFVTIILSMSISALIPFLWWRSEDEEAILRLWDSYAILIYKGQEIRIDKGSLKIELLKARGSNLYCYRLKIPGRSILLNPSRIEKRKSSHIHFSSLEMAMDSLYYYEQDSLISEKLETSFYDFKLILNLTNASLFDDSPYFVDFEYGIVMSEEGCFSALIREKEDADHIVGDLLIDIRNMEEGKLQPEYLKKRPIVAILELDER